MSLTRHLESKSSPIHKFFRAKFPNGRSFLKEARSSIRSAVTIRPPERVDYSTIGTALDYRIRFAFSITSLDEMVAWQGAALLKPRDMDTGDDSDSRGIFKSDLQEHIPASSLIDSFFDGLESTLQTLNPVGRRLSREHENELARYCYVLALFEQIYRAGPTIQSPLFANEYQSIDDLLNLANLVTTDDIAEISYTFHDQFEDWLQRPVALNPKFDGSAGVGGADADLILDGCLIEIKTTINPKIDLDWIYQLLGYTFLDYTNQHNIDAIGLYMARQGLFIQWPLQEAIVGMSDGASSDVIPLRNELRELVQSM
jgi:hypothetical protein